MQFTLSRFYSPIKRSLQYLPYGVSSRFMATSPTSSPVTAEVSPSPAATTPSSPKGIRQKIVLKDEDLVEKFVKGSGPGGQCINKRSSCVDLRHIPTGIRVQCQQTRSLQENRGIARKLLKEKLDDLWNGSLSKNAKKSTKIAKQKARNARRAKQKYGVSSSSSKATVDEAAATATSNKDQLA